MSFDPGNPAVSILMRSLKLEWQIQLGFCIALTAAAGAMIYFGYLLTSSLLVAGAFLLAWRVIPRKHRAYYRLQHLLQNRSDDIVWVYAMITEQNPFGIRLGRTCTLYFKLIDRNQFAASIPPEKLEQIKYHLEKLLPQASIGYSKDREQWYLVDPAMLLKGNRP